MDEFSNWPDRMSQWSIPNVVGFVAAVLAFSLIVRLVHALLRACRLHHELGGNSADSPGYRRLVDRNIYGLHPVDRCNGDRSVPRQSAVASDYWYNVILGTFELAIYPVLMRVGAWAVIGVWIGFKTIAQWNVWSNDRSTFNLFLLTNVILVLISFFALMPMVEIPATIK